MFHLFKTLATKRVIFVATHKITRNMHTKLVVLIALFGTTWTLQGQPAKEQALAQAAETFLAKAMEGIGAVPAVGIAIVRPERTVYVDAASLGNQPTDANTNFYIASCTKAYTALIAQHLDEQGIIRMEDPITKYLPEAQFAPELEADKVTIRDLITHTSGMSNDPIVHRLAYTGEHDPSTLINLLQYTTSNDAGRGNFRYTNFGYNLYTIISDKVTGKPWQDWLAELIFEPAGMTRTTAYMSKTEQPGWSLAKPYLNLIGEPFREASLIKTDKSMQSAGGLITTATDAGKWLQLQLNEGKLGGKQVVPAAHIEVSHQKHVETGGDDFGGFGRAYYGYGWRVGTFHDHPNVNHFGGYPGYLTHFSFDPEAEIGVAVLTNEGFWGDNIMNLVAGFVYDWWYGDPEQVEADYEKQLKKMVASAKKTSKRIAADRDKRAGRTWQLELDFPAYAGTFKSAKYGTVVVTPKDESLHVQSGNLECMATPFTETNTVRVEMTPGRGSVLQFLLDDGEVVGLYTDGERFEKVR